MSDAPRRCTNCGARGTTLVCAYCGQSNHPTLIEREVHRIETQPDPIERVPFARSSPLRSGRWR